MLPAMTSAAVDPVVRDLSRTLLPRVDEFALRMAEQIRAQEPLYADGQAVTPEELRESCRNNLLYVFGRLAGEPNLGTEAPRATGVRRAEAGVPLSALLQAFRIGGRLIWELLVEHADADAQDTLLRCAADIWAVSDDLAEAATDAYRGTSADRARHDSQVRTALLNSLLDGKLGDGARLWESAALLRLPQQGTFALVAAECPSPGEEALPRIEERLRRHDVASAWRLDAELQEGLVTLRATFDIARLSAELGRTARGRVGISETYPNLDQTAAALRQARLACAAGTPGTTSLVRFDEQPVAVLLVSAPDASQSVARRVLGRVFDVPEDDRAIILETVRVWLASSGSTSTAASRLHVHRNTVRYRLRRLETLTDRSLADPLDVAELHVALECARMLGLG
jgi:PucR C-terminal helix-turn-helix domain/GGDEF-like domain